MAAVFIVTYILFILFTLCIFSIGGISVDTIVIVLAILCAATSICIVLNKIARILSNNDNKDKKE